MYCGLHHNGSGEFLPGPAEVAPNAVLDGLELAVGEDAAVVEDDARRLLLVGAALRGDDVLLVVERLPHHDHAVLEDGGGVAEDEVDRAGDDAAAVELAVGLRVESVLVALEPAVDEDGAVGLDAGRHCLVLLGACRVPESHCSADETVSLSNCN